MQRFRDGLKFLKGGDLVWFKQKGNPWWPASICQAVSEVDEDGEEVERMCYFVEDEENESGPWRPVQVSKDVLNGKGARDVLVHFFDSNNWCVLGGGSLRLAPLARWLCERWLSHLSLLLHPLCCCSLSPVLGPT